MKTSCRTIILSSILGILLLPGLAAGQILQARIVATSMECIFCSFDLQKQLKQIDGISDWDVDIDEDYVSIYPVADSPLTAEDLGGAVAATRLALRRLQLVVEGDIVFMGERWALQAGDDSRVSMYLLADGEKLNALLEAAGVEEPFSAYSKPTEGLGDVVVEGSVNRSTPAGHVSHPYTLQIDSYCLDPRTLSFSLEPGLEPWEWRDLRRRLAIQPGIYAGWWQPETQQLLVIVCGEEYDMEDPHSILPENIGIEGQ